VFVPSEEQTKVRTSPDLACEPAQCSAFRHDLTAAEDSEDPDPSIRSACQALNRVKLGPVAAVSLASLVCIWVVLSGGTAFGNSSWLRYSDQALRISYVLPTAWRVQSEQDLEKDRFLSGPYPTYVLIAGAEPASQDGVPNPPSDYVFSETPSPWFMILVEALPTVAPSPHDAYRLGPDGEVTLQEEQGLDPVVVGLTKPVEVASGGIDGSEDRTEVIVPGAGDIELNEVVYTKGKTAWITVVGCTVACYNANVNTLATVINNVRVGTVSPLGRS
jgi:hypothetical protein